MVPPDPGLIDPIAPETLETDLGHGDIPQTSESFNNDSTLSTKAKLSCQIPEEKLGHDESALNGHVPLTEFFLASNNKRIVRVA